MDFKWNSNHSCRVSEQSRELSECTVFATESIWIIIALSTLSRISFLLGRIIFLFQMHRKQRISTTQQTSAALFHFLLCAATSSLEFHVHSDTYKKISILSVPTSHHQQQYFRCASIQWKRFSIFLGRASHDESSFFHQSAALFWIPYFMVQKYWAKTSKATLLSTCHFVGCVNVCTLEISCVYVCGCKQVLGLWVGRMCFFKANGRKNSMMEFEWWRRS